jgi:hypothetical protein
VSNCTHLVEDVVFGFEPLALVDVVHPQPAV